MSDKVVSFWRGKRSTYNEKIQNNEIDYWTRYTVTEENGLRTEYFGLKPISIKCGELYPVIDVVSTLPATLNVGDRYLVGHDKDGDNEAEYNIVEITADSENPIIYPLDEFRVRIQNKNYWAYQVIDGILKSYDQIIDCGTY